MKKIVLISLATVLFLPCFALAQSSFDLVTQEETLRQTVLTTLADAGDERRACEAVMRANGALYIDPKLVAQSGLSQRDIRTAIVPLVLLNASKACPRSAARRYQVALNDYVNFNKAHPFIRLNGPAYFQHGFLPDQIAMSTGQGAGMSRAIERLTPAQIAFLDTLQVNAPFEPFATIASIDALNAPIILP